VQADSLWPRASQESVQQAHAAGPPSIQMDPSAPKQKNSEAPLHDALCIATSAMISSRFAMSFARSNTPLRTYFYTV
jgi:hypothetical protein